MNVEKNNKPAKRRKIIQHRTQSSMTSSIYYFFARKSIWGTDMGEMIWAPSRWTYPFNVFYYNVKRQSVRRVEVKGIEEKLLMGRDHPKPVFTFTNHVENLMFLQ
ncbi:unnamed protein product [Eruca vesicaria subsp. sativa]|uniref:F-box associated beta-propeller type 3 domain-containing protein n=1 Tax=Eruca vesicaria subsp. sativa TaxID=29727 RepID=A0ABC8M586_ERUVS|nr:unnamed protein product [Eruca vesicaria subsp. sativa]